MELSSTGGPALLSKEAENIMSRRRDQEDVFKPLDDSPSDENIESQRSGRGWEIKLGLLVLVLLIGGTGYVAYNQFIPAGDADETIASSSRLNLEGDAEEMAGSHVVPAVTQPEPQIGAQPLVMTQFSDMSAPKKPASADAWTASESAADQVPQALEAPPNYAYAANYGGEPYQSIAPSTGSTFAPMPNPDNFATGVTAPLPSAMSPMPSAEPVQKDMYGNNMVSQLPESTLPNQPAGQPEAAAPGGEVQYAPHGMSAFQGDDFRAASQAAASPAASAPPVGSSKAPSASQFEPSAPSYTSPQQQSYAGTTATAPAYTALPASPPPVESPYPSYTPATTAKTPAEYAGLSSGNAAEEKPADAWQQPTVIPVDGRYTAQPNDNFFTISKKVYGSGAYFEALAKYNKDQYPKANQLRIGDVVQTPPAETLEGRYPELCPKAEHREAAKRRTIATAGRSLSGRRVYVVQEGDSLFDIARFELGAASKVADLIELNRDVLGDQINYLTPGMQLVLPETLDQPPRVTRNPPNSLNSLR